MKKVFLIIVVSAFCISLCSCRISNADFAEKMSVPYSAGEIRDGMYINEEIGIAFPIPDSETYTNQAKYCSENFTVNPGIYRVSAQSTLFESIDSNQNLYLGVYAYYQKYPEAKKFDSKEDFLESEFRSNAIRQAVTDYRGEWKDKYPLTEITTTESENPNYSYYSAYHIEHDVGLIPCMILKDDYYILFVFRGYGEYPDESSVFEIMNGITFIEE